MNDQLLTHLQRFDESFDGEPSEPNTTKTIHSQSGWEKMVNAIRRVTIGVKDNYRPFCASDTWRDDVHKCLWVLPLGFILIDYIGIFFSASITVLGFMIIVSRRDIFYYRTKGREALQPPLNTGISEVRSLAGLDQIQNCRREVSRLLGLVGAPALDWVDFDALSDMDDLAMEPSSEACMLVVNFLEAHVQLLVTIDEVYQWLKVSASMHLGLGPRSNCVDRVERASIARSLRNEGKGQSSDAPMVAVGSEPHRLGWPVVALSNIRRALARQMVDQYDSLLQVWCRVQEKLDIIPFTDAEDPLDDPNVVDLAWIRDARERLATILSDSANICTTSRALVLFTTDSEVRSWMKESTSSARNSHEYLQSTLLLKEQSTASDPMSGCLRHPLLSSLVNYRENLVALLAATWSCQQCMDSKVMSSEDDRRGWWNRMQQLSTTCREIEADIGLRFFSDATSDDEETNHDDEEDQAAIVDWKHDTRISNDFQLSDDGIETPVGNKTQNRLPTKTTVFKGHGAKSDRPSYRVKKEVSKGKSPSLPPRDMMSERQMIQELRNRIMLMRSQEEEESDHELENEAMEAARLARKPAAPVFLGASGMLLSELKMSLPMSSLAGRQEEEEIM